MSDADIGNTQPAIEQKHFDKTASVGAFVGITRWKRQRVRDFFTGSPDAPFLPSIKAAIQHIEKSGVARNIAIWPSRVTEEELTAIPDDIGIIRIEDGFIRSVGLGGALTLPCSIVADRRGIYFDHSRESDLEHILNNADFSSETLKRADDLKHTIIESSISKYNLDAEPINLPDVKQKILVIGQVADDLSVQYGGQMSMLGFLKKVRAAQPDAYLIFKPHPDVASGFRDGGIDEVNMAQLCDQIVSEADTLHLCAQVDAVYVLTSLTGFEAMLRGYDVHVYGSPFYAGWGLTRDYSSIARRERKRSLSELMAASLIEYPLYYHPAHNRACSVEEIISYLGNQSGKQPSGFQKLLGKASAMLRR